MRGADLGDRVHKRQRHRGGLERTGAVQGTDEGTGIPAPERRAGDVRDVPDPWRDKPVACVAQIWGIEFTNANVTAADLKELAQFKELMKELEYLRLSDEQVTYEMFQTLGEINLLHAWRRFGG